MKLGQVTAIYFIGIGGIGMSALARFFSRSGKVVAGYDRTETPLTQELVVEGIGVHYADDVSLISSVFHDKDKTLVVYTPAVPAQHNQLNWFRDNGFTIMKRAEVLGLISEGLQSICVAGTHGKTTVSTLTAHLLKQSAIDCHAFLGGISKNYQTNYLLSTHSNYVVLEADEFDRSFLHLHPNLAVITAVDADHLDIYGDKGKVLEAFEAFASRVNDNGMLLLKKGIALNLKAIGVKQQLTYALEDVADYYAVNIVLEDGLYRFDLNTPTGMITNLQLGIPGLLNVENAVAASALALNAGVTSDELRNGLGSFSGIRRRFDYWLKSPKFALIDDYAHHPEEIKATAKSVRAIYPDKKIVALFQPHLFSRTKDFYLEFAEALSLFDEVVLMDIYPAREEPLEGITSQLIAQNIKVPVVVCERSHLANELLIRHPDVVLVMGAGDVDKELPGLKSAFAGRI
jgi:UDP-N-acetylmuramate--alanine ligase